MWGIRGRRTGRRARPRGALALCLALLGALPGAAWALDPTQPLADLGLDAWTTADGLPGMSVNDVARTPDGYLWLATYDGLARFDGVRARVYRAELTPGLEDDGIRGLSVARDGALWIATNGGGVSRLAAGAFTHFGAAEGVEDPFVWAVQADAAGNVWAGTSSGRLLRLSGGRFHTEAEAGAPILSIRPGGDGSLWLATLGGGVRRRAGDGAWSAITAADGLASDNAGSVLVEGPGDVWVAGSGGVSRIQGSRIDRFRLGQGAAAWDLFRDRHGTLWASGASGRLARLRDGRFEEVPAAVGLPLTVISAIREDDEGSLWLGTAGHGLLRLREATFAHRDRAAGLPGEVVFTGAEAPDGSLVVGTSGGIGRLADGRWDTLLATDTTVRSLAVAPDGSLWAGLESGLARLAGGRWTRFTHRDGLANDTVRGVLVDRHGAVWAATLDGLSRYAGGRFTSWHRADGLPSTALLGLIEAPDGSLWIATEGAGVVRFADGRFTTVGAHELAGRIVLGLRAARDGGIWLGTTRGLARIDGTSVRLFGAAHGVVGAVSQVLEDDLGQLWLGGGAGVQRIGRSDVRALLRGSPAPVRVERFGTADGLGSAQCTSPAQPAGLRTRDGRLHFFTWGGISTVDPRRLVRDSIPPPVHVEEVLADGQAVVGEVAPGARRLEIHYTGICLLTPRRVQFRYRLEGFDADWVDAGQERSARYTNVPPGRYRFRVKAANGSGVWNESEAVAPIVLRPYFWQTRAFALACALALLTLLGLAYGARVGILRRRALRLQVLVDERTRELQAATAAAETSRHFAEQAHAAKTRLLSIVAHDLKNPLTSIAGYADLLAHQDPAQLPEAREMLVRSSSRMIRLIDDLLLTAALEAGRLTLQRAPVDLARLVQAAVGDAGAEAGRKQMRVDFHAPPEAAVVDGDEDRLRQVVDNLLSNALKYSPRGRTVGVRLGAGHGVVRLEVVDEGQGLAPDELERAFTAFERLTPRPTGGEGSTGLGLSIVKQIVELHGGRVWAESDGRGRGSKFVVELPRAADQA